jgi:hypothetical protein
MMQQVRRGGAIGRVIVAALMVVAVLFVAIGGQPRTTQAEDYTVGCNANELISAIGSANNSPGASRIALDGACVYVLTEANSTGSNGPNGLPLITAAGGQLTIIGNGATIVRDGGAPIFRLFEVAPGAGLTLVDLELRNGDPGDHDGGAILNFGNLELNSVVLREHRTGIDGASGYGGALSTFGAATIRRSALLNNIAGDDGGAIYFDGAALTVESTTIAFNEARGTPGIGAGILAIDNPVTLNNVTIVNNTALGPDAAGAGIYSFFAAAAFTVTNTIVANNTAANNPNCSGVLGAGSADNLEFGGTSCAGFLNANPLLSYNAALNSFVPALASPAANAGNLSTCTSTDQLGIFRGSDDNCEIGAVEIDFGKTTIDFNDEGLVGLNGAAAQASLNAIYGSRGVSFDAYRATLFDELLTDGAAVTVFTDPAGADILINFAYPVDQVSVEMLLTDGVASTLTARDSSGTAADIETAGGAIIDTDTRSTPGPLTVGGSCIRSVQLENVSVAFRFDDLVFRPQAGVDADNNGIIDSCEGAAASSLVVTNTNDSGPGSLRAAILAANAQPGLDTITFNIPGSGVQTIDLATNLPFITDPVAIDGLSQPGASCAAWPPTLRIELSGAAGAAFGLLIDATGGSTVRGLVINRFSATAIFVNDNDNTFQCNIIGADPTGTIARGNGQIGIFINGSSNNLVGGTLPTQRNLITANGEQLRVAAANNNVIQGNYLGTNVTGTAPLGFASIAMLLTGGNNQIGGTAGVTPGGACTGACNLFSGYSFAAIDLAAPSGANNQIQGNYFGLNASGNAMPGFFGSTGIWINGSANNNTIGGTATGAGNLFAGHNTQAIWLDGIGATNNQIVGNIMGTNSAGSIAIPNGIGVFAEGGAANNRIGGTTAAAGNLIVNSVGPAIRLDGGSGNSVLGNRIFGNLSPQLELLNGANGGPTAPTVTTAVPGFPSAGQSNVQGWLTNAVPNASYTVQLFGGTSCAPGGGAEARTFLDSFTLLTDADGTAPFTRDLAELLADGSFVSATATDSAGNTSALAICAFAGPDNTVWYQALPLSAANPTTSQPIGLPEQVRWYYVELDPQSRLAVNLTNLPAGYDIALFNDLNARAEALTAAADDDFAAALALTQTQIDYTTVEASNFIVNTLAPELYSPEAYASAALAPNTFSSSVIAESVISPFKISPFKISPFKISPFKISPFKISPFKISPFKISPFKISDFASIVIDSGLLAYTEAEGTVPRTLTLNSYNERGRVYIAVYGRNGAFDPVQPFTVSAFSSDSACANVTPPSPAISGLNAQAGNFTTLFLTDLSRLPGDAGELAQLEALITSFNARSEINGVLVNVGADARVAAANATADSAISCPEAKNLVANEIKRIVDDYRTLNPGLRYVVLVGGDEVIPFVRYPDQALLGNESGFQPPVVNDSSSEAALRLGYILGQDEYGARYTVAFRTTRLPIPDLPVGRLVETAADAITLINRYIADDGLITPERSFVSGYDFHFDSASGIAAGLELGTDRAVDTLLSPSTDSFQEPGTWTASDLRDALAGADYDLLYLAGHFSDGALKAADYATILRAADLLDLAPSRLAGALVVSPGCHSGYNTPDGAAILGATDQPDWAQYFARRGTTLVAGTGYQYGDTQFVQFAEDLYTRFFEQLRIDTVPNSPLGDEVEVGQALVLAKQRYLIDSPVIRGIDKKTLTISALFGLPMTRVNMQGERLSPPPAAPLPNSFGPLTPLGDPGDIYRLQAANVTVTPDLTVETINLTSLDSGVILPATYVRGAAPDDIIARPGEPVLPLSQYRVGQANQQLRGALLLSADYSEATDVLPLTGAPATELRGVHITFPSEAFYPEKWWTVNQLGALTGVNSADRARLQLTAAQFLANPEQNIGTIRYYDGPAAFRLYYSDQTEADTEGVNPALAGAPGIPVVTFSRDGALVNVQVSANGGGVPLREVWLTFTADSGSLAGRWQSIPLNPSAANPSLYVGSYSMPEGTQGFSFFVQAANAAGFTALNTNFGLYYQAGGFVNGTLVPPPLPPVTPSDANALATSLSLNLPGNPTFGEPATFGVQLSAPGAGNLSGLEVSLSLGAQTVRGTTNASGQVSFTLTPFSTGLLPVGATFGGTANLQPAFALDSLTIVRQQPALTAVAGDSAVTATLTASSGGIQDARIYLSVGGVVVTGRTNPEGVAILPIPALPAGDYPFSVTYLLAPTGSGFVTENDLRYLPATATGVLNVQAGLDTEIIAGPSGVTGDSAVTFTFSGSGAPELSFACSLSQSGADEEFTPCTSPLHYKGLANGDYIFRVRAVASDGTVDATPAERAFTVNQILYRARQQGARVWIERNIAAAGLNDFDTEVPDGWALVGRTNGAADNGELRGFYVENGVPYATIFNRSNNKGDRCILVTPRNLGQVRRGQTRLLYTILDPVPCPAPTGFSQLP